MFLLSTRTANSFVWCQHGKMVECLSYPGANHGFSCVDSVNYNEEQARKAWKPTLEFLRAMLWGDDASIELPSTSHISIVDAPKTSVVSSKSSVMFTLECLFSCFSTLFR